MHRNNMLTLILVSFSAAVKVLPQGYHAMELPTIPQLYEATVDRINGLKAVTYSRSRIPTFAAQEKLLFSESTAATLKRTLLGPRQLCYPGYGYCICQYIFRRLFLFFSPCNEKRAEFYPLDSGRCCPNGGDGGCCDDGTCVTSSQTCCAGGGACGTGKQCCDDGCHPEDNTCCIGGGSCEPGRDCCGNGRCSPIGGECCQDGSGCDAGLHCVIYDGEQRCCEDLSCSGSQGGGNAGDTGGGDSPTGRGGDETSSIFSTETTEIPIPSITLPSITPISLPPLPTPTFALPPDIQLTYYTTTWIWYYYFIYLTSTLDVESYSTITTSTRLTTTMTVSVKATASAAARSIFRSLSAEATFPSVITNPAVLSSDTFSVTSTTETTPPTSSSSEQHLPLSTFRGSSSRVAGPTNILPSSDAGRTARLRPGWMLAWIAAVGVLIGPVIV